MQRKARLAALAATALVAVSAAPAAAETLVGVTDTDKLVAFDSATPGTVGAGLPITGLDTGETIKGIDYRPATLQLYALGVKGTAGQLYKIDIFTGVASKVTTTPLTLDASTEFDIDFNPTVDRLRVVGSAGINIRVNPNTGNLATADTNLNPGTPRVVAAAYSNNHPASAVYPGVPTTTLYDIDSTSDKLQTQNANPGTLSDVGALGINADDIAGFDISTSGVNPDTSDDTAYADLRVGGAASLYKINLTTGAATSAGALGGTDKIKDISVVPTVPTFVVLESGTPQSLAYARADRPGAVTTGIPISGLKAGDKLLAIDTRPSTGVLYGLGSSSTLYTLDARTGVATPINASPFTPALSNTSYGFDFNPTSQSAALRLLTGTTNSTLTVAAPNTHTPRSPLKYLGPSGPSGASGPSGPTGPTGPTGAINVTHAAYIKETTGGTPATRLFDIDVSNDSVAEQVSTGPQGFNDGYLQYIGQLGVDATDEGGLDAVDKFDQLFAALTVGGKSGLYNINGSGLAAGAANGSVAKIGDLGVPTNVTVQGLALQTAASQSAVPVPTATSPYYPIPTATPTSGPVTPPTKAKAKVKLKGVKVSPKRDPKAPFKFNVKGTVDPAGGASTASASAVAFPAVSKRAAKGTRLRIVVKRSGSKKVRFNKKVKVNAKGKFAKKVVFKKAKKQLGRKKGRLSFRVQYLGNSKLKKSRKVVRSVAYGKKR